METDNSTASPANPLQRQLLAHGSVALLLAASLVLANAWELTNTSNLARYITAAWAILCGLGLSHIIHEWCHYLGAKLAGSGMSLKPQLHPLFFDFDLEGNTSAQFLCLSLGGLAGNLALLYIANRYAAVDSIVTTSLLAAVLGQLVFVLLLELPVSVEVALGKAPLAALSDHFSQGGPLFLRAALGGITTATLVFLLH